eukprot:TRINITY_DN883_c0_g1_i1.p1 TRINITY_DN883_c0_g1~~TRINITY_DN883_c0_g1_i1.p1  ORF type:complete len:214 (+),score=67.24 TRINITY_DN883_c0_g1_i1:33-674(+)
MSDGFASYQKHQAALEQAKREIENDAQEIGHSWKEVKSKDGVVVKKTEKKGTDIPAFKAVGNIKTTPTQFFEEVLNNSHRRREWNPSWDHANVLDKYEQDGIHFELYQDAVQGALGGLIGARDFVEIRNYEERNGGYLFFFTSTTDDRAPPREGYIRGTLFASGYLVEPVGNEIRVTWITHTDIGGKVPTWMVSKGMTGEMIDTFKRWRKLFE